MICLKMIYQGLVVGDIIAGRRGGSSTSSRSQCPNQHTAPNLNYYYVDDTGRANLIGLDEDHGSRDYYQSLHQTRFVDVDESDGHTHQGYSDFTRPRSSKRYDKNPNGDCPPCPLSGDFKIFH